MELRPIALTSCLCKTMERIVNDRLVWMLESNGLISNYQCGFRKKSKYIRPLGLPGIIHWKCVYQKGACIRNLFDLEKAYDTTWKYGIMKDLHSLGFRGHLPKFISSFLSDRTFQVQVGCTPV